MHFLYLGRLNRVGESEEGECQVGEAVLVQFDLLVTLDQLVLLQSHQAGHKGRRGGDSGDDAAGNQLGLVTVGSRDTVVTSSIRNSYNY